MEALERLYPDQEPFVWEDTEPLQAVVCYVSTQEAPHWHYVTVGLGRLLADRFDEDEGLELSIRLLGTTEEPPEWPVDVLQKVCAYVLETGRKLASGDYLALAQPIPDSRQESVLVVQDYTVEGARVLQLTGLTRDEEYAIRRWNSEGITGLLRCWSPLLIIDPARINILEEASVQQAMMEGIERDGSSQRTFHVEGLEFAPGEPARLRIPSDTARYLRHMFRDRLRFRRDFVLRSPELIVVFQPADQLGWKPGTGSLRLDVPPEMGEEVCSSLERALNYAGFSGLSVEVV